MFSRALLIQGAFDKKTYGEANNCQIKKEERELVNEGDKTLFHNVWGLDFEDVLLVPVEASSKNNHGELSVGQQCDQRGPVLTKKLTPPRNTGNK